MAGPKPRGESVIPRVLGKPVGVAEFHTDRSWGLSGFLPVRVRRSEEGNGLSGIAGLLNLSCHLVLVCNVSVQDEGSGINGGLEGGLGGSHCRAQF